MTTRNKVKIFLQNNQKTKHTEVNIKKLESFIGRWFCYHYPDSISTRLKLYNSLDEGIPYIYEDQISIDKDFHITSKMYGVGKLHINNNQSNIIFEDKNTKDIIEYTFDNDQINNYQFDFIKLSKMRHSRRKILNSGFFSNKSLNENEAQILLGEDISKMQFKVDLNFIDRVSAYNEIKDY